MVFRYGLAAVLLGWSVFAQAQATTKGPLDMNAPFAEQRVRIQAALDDGKTYSEITAENRSKVTVALDRIGHLLGPGGDVARLNGNNKVQVFNDQELVNGLLTSAAADSRLVCKRERPTGSNMFVSQCMTVAQRDRQREQAKDDMRDRRTLSPLPNGGR